MSNVNWIGRKTDRGASYIYCHWGGDLDQNGQILYDNYDEEDKVLELLSKGDASYIDKTIEECSFYVDKKGEEKAEPLTDINSSLRLNSAHTRELCFLWRKGEWWVSSGMTDNDWMKLSTLMENKVLQRKYERTRGVFLNDG